jgi:hypothetical protein
MAHNEAGARVLPRKFVNCLYSAVAPDMDKYWKTSGIGELIHWLVVFIIYGHPMACRVYLKADHAGLRLAFAELLRHKPGIIRVDSNISIKPARITPYRISYQIVPIEKIRAYGRVMRHTCFIDTK